MNNSPLAMTQSFSSLPSKGSEKNINDLNHFRDDHTIDTFDTINSPITAKQRDFGVSWFLTDKSEQRPVSNMFSAYGGIRWGSGLNRQFQYEECRHFLQLVIQIRYYKVFQIIFLENLAFIFMFFRKNVVFGRFFNCPPII
jgi:hypothetical protein